nr:hypothetical protein [Tanacetum cinerariifolium]
MFRTEKVEYLGHVITKDEVATDGSKIEAMQNWPRPTNPLTQLLKKNGFGWNEQAQEAFVKLKQAIIKAPVLKLPNFNELFIIETDASHTGIGAVLQQGGHPVAYYSKTLATRHHTLSTYENELLAVIQALNKWRGYLLDRHVKITIDHFSLKYLLEQRITTPSQMKWLPKLMGFDYDILYKKGSKNNAADALSRIPTKLQKLIKDLEANPQSHKDYTWLNGQLRRKGKLVVGNNDMLRQQLLQYFHSDPSGGHSGVQATNKRITGLCYWRKLRQQVKVFVAHYKVWTEISMDFIGGLPSSYGKTAIFVVVDRLNKYAHFVPLSHPFTAVQITQIFLDNVYKLHGLPKVIVSDRDKIFISLFWKKLFKALQVSLHLSTAYHPQSDGQTEVVNRCLECYLRCMSSEKPKSWSKWVSLAEYNNTTYHTSIKTTPYEVLYGQPPFNPIAYIQVQCLVDAVDSTLAAREAMIQLLEFYMERAQNRMKTIADAKRTDREFEVCNDPLRKKDHYIIIMVSHQSIFKKA